MSYFPLPSSVAICQGEQNYSSEEKIRALVSKTIRTLNLPTGFIQPGEKVILKPNWVKEHDERHPGDDTSWEYVVTHPLIIETVAEWAARTYHWPLHHILWEIPAVQLALLMRQYAAAQCAYKGNSLFEDLFFG